MSQKERIEISIDDSLEEINIDKCFEDKSDINFNQLLKQIKNDDDPQQKPQAQKQENIDQFSIQIDEEVIRYFSREDRSQTLRLKEKAYRALQLDQAERYEIEKTLAEKFITLGYGYGIAVRALKKRKLKLIHSDYYNNLMSAIARRAFRTLQAFLTNQCKQPIKKLTFADCTLVRSPILQGSKWLVKQELDTLHKFIIRAYNLKEVHITEDQASRLYGQLIQSATRFHQIHNMLLTKPRKKRELTFEEFKVKFGPSHVGAINNA